MDNICAYWKKKKIQLPHSETSKTNDDQQKKKIYF